MVGPLLMCKCDVRRIQIAVLLKSLIDKPCRDKRKFFLQEATAISGHLSQQNPCTFASYASGHSGCIEMEPSV